MRPAPATPERTPAARARQPGATPRAWAAAAVPVVLQRCACGGGCPRCRAAAAQPKLAINTPGDAYEREADRIADAMVSGAPAGVSTGTRTAAVQRCACGGSCPACRAKQEGEEELQRADAGGSGGPAFAPPVVHDVLSSPGQALQPATRGMMELRFGAGFGGVRVHTDRRAAESARAVDAHAYTVGRDVVFGAGRYQPGTRQGDRLIAHELAHVVQQGGAAAGVQRQNATATPWNPPVRADELTPGTRTDRLGSRTFTCGDFSVFVPAGAASADTNRVHVFFSPGGVTGAAGNNAVSMHGLRSAAETSQWIVLSVPGIEGGAYPITTAQITACLASVGRAATIERLRLSAHSRGAAGLAVTLQHRRLTPSPIEHVTLLDVTDFAPSVTAGLRASHVPGSRVTAYNVVFGSFPVQGARNVQMSMGCARSIGYARLIRDGVATGRAPTPLPTAIAARVNALTLPPRGSFSTAAPTPPGKTDLNAFCRNPANAAALAALRDGEPPHPWSLLSVAQYTARAATSPYAFITEYNVLGVNPRAYYSPQTLAHHLFVAEIGHEMFS